MKIAVKLANASNSFKDDQGNKLEPHVVHHVEDSERILKAIGHGMLERIREAEETKDEVKEEKTNRPRRSSTLNLENKE